MNETILTVCGNVVDEPRYLRTDSGVPIASFRIASTERRFRGGEWIDGNTSWVSVTCWRSLALNVQASVHRGERVVVHGRLRTPQWKRDDGSTATKTEIDAYTVGHDLTYGTSDYSRVMRVERAEPPERAEADALLAQLDTSEPRPPFRPRLVPVPSMRPEPDPTPTADRWRPGRERRAGADEPDEAEVMAVSA